MDKIVGQCEGCGAEYTIHQNLMECGTVICTSCGKETQNWDTPDSPQMAPSLVRIDMRDEDVVFTI